MIVSPHKRNSWDVMNVENHPSRRRFLDDDPKPPQLEPFPFDALVQRMGEQSARKLANARLRQSGAIRGIESRPRSDSEFPEHFTFPVAWEKPLMPEAKGRKTCPKCTRELPDYYIDGICEECRIDWIASDESLLRKISPRRRQLKFRMKKPSTRQSYKFSWLAGDGLEPSTDEAMRELIREYEICAANGIKWIHPDKRTSSNWPRRQWVELRKLANRDQKSRPTKKKKVMIS